MTNKEKYEALVSEIKRLKDETAIGLNEWENGVENGRMEVINALEAKVNSMNEEQPCDDLEKFILTKFNSFVGKHGEFDKTYIDGMAKAAAVLCGKAGANWQKEQFEKNRLKHCDNITNEQAELEQKFLDQHLDKYNRMPTFLDAIEYGMRLKEEQINTKED